MPATSHREEHEFQASWTLRQEHRDNPVFGQLIDNEFLDPEALVDRLSRSLQALTRYVFDTVPYYRDRFAAAGLAPAAVHSADHLARLPVLGRHELAENFERLRSTRFRADDRTLAVTRTSGSTGIRVGVLRNAESRNAFPLLWQRQARWYRHDLHKRYARIRLPNALYRLPDGSLLPPGRTVGSRRWMYSGRFFETGEEYHFSVANTRPEHLRWIERYRPAYLMTFPGILEELALANDCQPLPHVEGLVSISGMLTDPMRRRVETSFGLPVYQNYGLNEVGLVAVQCPAGRYHPNIEHALVEIVDEDGQPVAPGHSGRLLVTALNNPAMPLLRYDTGDIAVASDGPCPCGRTLPSFGNILGRHRRYTHTPEGTRPRLNGLSDALTHMPNALFRNLRQYQLYQLRDKSIEVRVVARGPLHPQFSATLHARWRELNADGEQWPLRIVEVDAVKRSPSGKLIDFYSEFFDDEDELATVSNARATIPDGPS